MAEMIFRIQDLAANRVTSETPELPLFSGFMYYYTYQTIVRI